MLAYASTLKSSAQLKLFTQSHEQIAGKTVLLDHVSLIVGSTCHVSFPLCKTPSAGLLSLISKDRLALEVKWCPCQRADSWKELAAFSDYANVLKSSFA